MTVLDITTVARLFASLLVVHVYLIHSLHSASATPCFGGAGGDVLSFCDYVVQEISYWFDGDNSGDKWKWIEGCAEASSVELAGLDCRNGTAGEFTLMMV